MSIKSSKQHAIHLFSEAQFVVQLELWECPIYDTGHCHLHPHWPIKNKTDGKASTPFK
jgi:hypothetical protein